MLIFLPVDLPACPRGQTGLVIFLLTPAPPLPGKKNNNNTKEVRVDGWGTGTRWMVHTSPLWSAGCMEHLCWVCLWRYSGGCMTAVLGRGGNHLDNTQ